MSCRHLHGMHASLSMSMSIPGSVGMLDFSSSLKTQLAVQQIAGTCGTSLQAGQCSS